MFELIRDHLCDRREIDFIIGHLDARNLLLVGLNKFVGEAKRSSKAEHRKEAKEIIQQSKQRTNSGGGAKNRATLIFK